MKRVWALLTLAWCATVCFGADKASQAVKQFEKTYRNAKTLRATFLETYSDGGHIVRTEAGVAVFQKPRKMRWEYESPEKNLYIVDGKTAWFYVPSDHTVTRTPFKKSDDWRTPFALLAGQAKVSRLCKKVTEDKRAQPRNKDVIRLTCELRGQTKDTAAMQDNATGQTVPEQVQFEVSKVSGELRSVTIRDRGNIVLSFQFANWEFNPPVPEMSFQFDPPKGVAIVNGDLSVSTGKQGQD